MALTFAQPVPPAEIEEESDDSRTFRLVQLGTETIAGVAFPGKLFDPRFRRDSTYGP